MTDEAIVVREISSLLEDTSRFVIVAATKSLARLVVNEDSASIFLESTNLILKRNSLESRSCLVDVFTILLHESVLSILNPPCFSIIPNILRRNTQSLSHEFAPP